MPKTSYAFSLLLVSFLLLFTAAGSAQNNSDYTIVVTPASLNLKIDETVQLSGSVQDARGKGTRDTVRFYSRDRASVQVTPEGKVKAVKAGNFELIAFASTSDGQRLRKSIPVTVAHPPITEITFRNVPSSVYNQTVIPVEYNVRDAKGFKRENANVRLTSSNPQVASIDEFGQLHAHKAGAITLTARGGKVQTTRRTKVVANPVSTLEFGNTRKKVRTGDVISFRATPLNNSGKAVSDAPVTYSFISQTDERRGSGTSAQIEANGRFVAADPGLYTIVAKSGPEVAETTVRVVPRNMEQSLEVVGHGLVSDVHTSDLWVWEGTDGRDYAITGTWGAKGEAYFWDVTDPSNMSVIDTVTVDARTVNDVKISKDGRIGVITREGASDRKNGIVLLDVSDPRNVKIISEYTKGLTGGVHNAFIYKDHVFAVNNGRRYDIIDISDPANPRTVSRFELDTPGHAVHDVWVENGIAYSSNWEDGVVAVDVGSTPAAQSPERHDVGAGSFDNPVKLGSYKYPSGWNHAAFPFKSRSTGDFYIIAGDEAFPNGLYIQDRPTEPAGWIHFVKFEKGWDSPQEVARYQVPEAGTHNFWVKDDTLYVAYYNGGLRVVDISGELMGNLYEQGREIARFTPTHHKGFIPNAPMTWGPQPYKGHIFISDWNSGIWALKLEKTPPGTQ